MTNLELIAGYYQLFNAANFEGMLTCLHPEVEHHINQGEVEIGVEKFAAFLEHMDNCYAEQVHGLVIMTEPNDRHFAAKFTVYGIYKATDGNFPEAKLQEYAIPAGAFLEVEDGLIKSVTTYYNLKMWLEAIADQ